MPYNFSLLCLTNDHIDVVSDKIFLLRCWLPITHWFRRLWMVFSIIGFCSFDINFFKSWIIPIWFVNFLYWMSLWWDYLWQMVLAHTLSYVRRNWIFPAKYAFNIKRYFFLGLVRYHYLNGMSRYRSRFNWAMFNCIILFVPMFYFCLSFIDGRWWKLRWRSFPNIWEQQRTNLMGCVARLFVFSSDKLTCLFIDTEQNFPSDFFHIFVGNPWSHFYKFARIIILFYLK